MWIDVLTAVAVVAAISLLLGVLLALFIRFFGIEDDERVKNIKNALPGANCGACGYKGCADYAEALAEGRGAPNLCVPGGAGTAKALEDILGVEVKAAEAKVAFVHCNGVASVTSKKADYKGIETCRACSMLYAGDGACAYGCLGCGDCADVCPTDAICLDDGIARIISERCIACGACVRTCPKGIISLVPAAATTFVVCSNKDKGADARKVCKAACIACKKCEKSCPEGAITVKDNLASIDYTKCTGCGICAECCPTGAIKNIQNN